MRILVVEDEVRLAATLQDLLELQGYSADVCHDGEAGLDNALTSIYDVIVLDVMGLYATELYNQFDVDAIIRIGSAGSLSDKVKVRDLVIAMCSRWMICSGW